MLPSLEPQGFDVEIKPDRARVVLALGGELDIASVEAVQAALTEVREAGWDDIVVDLNDVSFIDSTGLSALLTADERARREGWRFVVARGCEPLERLLEVSCLTSHLRRA